MSAFHASGREATHSPSENAETIVDLWRSRVIRDPSFCALKYFDGVLSVGELDRASDALGCWYQDHGVAPGDRVGIQMQNVPGFVIGLLAAWKVGATVLLLNPMYRRRELRDLLDDAKAVGVVCGDDILSDVRAASTEGSVRWVVSASPLDYQNRFDPRVFPSTERPTPSSDGDLGTIVFENDGRIPLPVVISPGDFALFTYTSGTTGPPKGATNTHGNVVAVATSFARWAHVESGDVVFVLAPLFHITGAVIDGAIGLLHDVTLVLAGRFHAEVTLDLFVEHRVTYTICSITVFNAILALGRRGKEWFPAAKYLYSGGAPIPPSTVQRFQDDFGVYIHNAYGMTETTSGVIAVPAGQHAPIDQSSGTLSIGKALPGLSARIVDPSGTEVASGEQGELQVSGPQVVPGYWNNPEATEVSFPGGQLRTGDGAFIDEDGWIYLVDRLKDLINVSGYKVWPREVEDVLYQHEAVFEAAVVGEPDDYRGEVVVAFVSLRPGPPPAPDELIAFCRERLAAYKIPRRVHIVDEMPKTLTGKIRRRDLRGSISSVGDS